MCPVLWHIHNGNAPVSFAPHTTTPGPVTRVSFLAIRCTALSADGGMIQSEGFGCNFLRGNAENHENPIQIWVEHLVNADLELYRCAKPLDQILMKSP
jgi:hypothetical protein